ncbi:MAG: hypothetical protein NZ807_12600 [Dehalococcoidia bacterium]|nr:hypothetical protein [Dehalococcoidia bacterium]
MHDQDNTKAGGACRRAANSIILCCCGRTLGSIHEAEGAGRRRS